MTAAKNYVESFTNELACIFFKDKYKKKKRACFVFYFCVDGMSRLIHQRAATDRKMSSERTGNQRYKQ